MRLNQRCFVNWAEARKQYPNSWLLIEAVNARSDNRQRILDDLVVLSPFSKSEEALQHYLKMHRQEPRRELYIAHTSREALEIEERRWAGVRAPAG